MSDEIRPMSDEIRLTMAIAFPLHTADRAALRRASDSPLPVIVPDSIAAPCTVCGVTLAVGPRLAARLAADASARLVCPPCAARLPGAADAAVESLGNPDSRLEES